MNNEETMGARNEAMRTLFFRVKKNKASNSIIIINIITLNINRWIKSARNAFIDFLRL